MDKRLYVPQKWFEDTHEARRKKCKVPEDLGFKTKPQLAAEMYREVRAGGILPYRYVVADSIYGANPDFIGAIEEKVGTTYFVSMPSDTLCWLQRPSAEERPVRRKGAGRVKSVVPETEKKPVDFAALASNINSFFWYRRKVSEGTKGPIEYEFTKRRITLCKDGLPCKTVWLIVKRTWVASGSTHTTSVTPQSVRDSDSSYGSVVFAGPSSSVLRKLNPNSAWIIMR